MTKWHIIAFALGVLVTLIFIGLSSGSDPKIYTQEEYDEARRKADD